MRLEFLVWFLVLVVQGVLLTLGFQGYLAVLGYLSSQQVLGNLGHLYLPCGQGILVIHSVLSVQEFQLGLGYHQ